MTRQGFVTDEELGRVTRRFNELLNRVQKGSCSPYVLADGLQVLIEGRELEQVINKAIDAEKALPILLLPLLGRLPTSGIARWDASESTEDNCKSIMSECFDAELTDREARYIHPSMARELFIARAVIYSTTAEGESGYRRLCGAQRWLYCREVERRIGNRNDYVDLLNRWFRECGSDDAKVTWPESWGGGWYSAPEAIEFSWSQLVDLDKHLYEIADNYPNVLMVAGDF